MIKMRHQDLNLLVIFDAIMTEGSITRAADRLALTQPAVSNALSRMRTVMKDELFVKDGRNIRPTVYAQNLWSQVREPLHHLEQAMDQGSFDPASATRTFRIASADALVDVIWPRLRQLIEKEAPGINIHAIPYTITNAESLLNDAEVDMFIGANVLGDSVIRTEYLYTPWYVCVMRKGHPLAKADLTVEEFAEADHLLVSLSGDITGITDQVLAQHGLSRRIAMSVNHFSAVTSLLKQSNLISVMPSTTIENAIFKKELAVVDPPVEITAPQLSLCWHKRQEHDPGLSWLRAHVSKIVREHAKQHYQMIEQRMCKNKEGGCTHPA
jgi:DNA-binding transcriptional LysR family regulator